MNNYNIIVKQLVSDAELDWDDRNTNPSGTHKITAASEDEALDDFHLTVPIAVLEDFEITVEEVQKIYDVPVQFVFEGVFKIKANSLEQAKEYTEKHCGLVLGGDIHSTLPDDEVDWEFPCHPDKNILL